MFLFRTEMDGRTDGKTACERSGRWAERERLQKNVQTRRLEIERFEFDVCRVLPFVVLKRRLTMVTSVAVCGENSLRRHNRQLRNVCPQRCSMHNPEGFLVIKPVNIIKDLEQCFSTFFHAAVHFRKPQICTRFRE